MVGHVDRRDFAAAVAHNDERIVSGGKQLVLRHRTAQTIDIVRLRSFELSAQNTHTTALIAGADQTGIVDVALVGGQNQCGDSVCTLIYGRKAGGGCLLPSSADPLTLM